MWCGVVRAQDSHPPPPVQAQTPVVLGCAVCTGVNRLRGTLCTCEQTSPNHTLFPPLSVMTGLGYIPTPSTAASHSHGFEGWGAATGTAVCMGALPSQLVDGEPWLAISSVLKKPGLLRLERGLQRLFALALYLTTPPTQTTRAKRTHNTPQ